MEHLNNLSDEIEYTPEELEEMAEREAAEAREKQTLHLLWDVQNYFGGKYNIIPFDEDEDDSPCIELRIADHSGNARNMDDLYEYHVSVVISDNDQTRQRFYNPDQNMPNEMYFTGDSSASEIIDAINSKINSIKDKHGKS
jgi:hypothetical protein